MWTSTSRQNRSLRLSNNEARLPRRAPLFQVLADTYRVGSAHRGRKSPSNPTMKCLRRSFFTRDLYDAFGDSCQICETQLQQYGGRRIAFGRIRTVRCLRDNLLIRQMLQKKTEGYVLVADGPATRMRANEKYFSPSMVRGQSAGLESTEEREVWYGMYRCSGFIRACKLCARALALH